MTYDKNMTNMSLNNKNVTNTTHVKNDQHD